MAGIEVELGIAGANAVEDVPYLGFYDAVVHVYSVTAGRYDPAPPQFGEVL